MAKDFLGQELLVGDEVAYMLVGYRDFRRGVISKINEKKLTISRKLSVYPFLEKVQQFHNQVIKINKVNNDISKLSTY